MSIAIKVENLGKKYIIRHEKKSADYETLSESLIQGSKKIIRKIRYPFNPSKINPRTQEEFWALKDINFEVNQGDKVGIIGRNGAGKSTLLKVLSRITEPTTGKIHINGRIASLLEVGTGFHPELTGRENIYLNGAILGMSRKEIKTKFDEIVAFSEVEKFLDTPVKRYSSGMYVRLAFSVAAHLEPEILVVDEVLAVGDAQFQKKCLGKMEEVGNEGRTVLFVSHNMAAIQKLCGLAIFLEGGKLNFEGLPETAISYYLGGGNGYTNNVFSVNQKKLQESESKGVEIHNIQMLSDSGATLSTLQTNDFVVIRIKYTACRDMANSSIAFIIQVKSVNGQEIFRLSTVPISGYHIDCLGSEGFIDLQLNSIPLAAGRYYLDVGVSRPNIEFLFFLEEVADFYIAPKDVYGSGVAIEQGRGLIVVPHKWTHHPHETEIKKEIEYAIK